MLLRDAPANLRSNDGFYRLTNSIRYDARCTLSAHSQRIRIDKFAAIAISVPADGPYRRQGLQSRIPERLA